MAKRNTIKGKTVKAQSLTTLIPFPLVRTLVEIYYDFQDQRIITNNRIGMNKQRNAITDAQLKQYKVFDILANAEQFEKDVKKVLEVEIKKHKIWKEYLALIQGVGPIISAGLLAYINDIGKFENISRLWQITGFGMNTFCKKCKKPTWEEITFIKQDGKTKTKAKRLKPMKICPECNKKTEPMIQKRMIGYMSNWNDKFKVLCWKIGQSILKQQASKSGYRKLYDQFKAEERRKHPKKIKKGGRTMYNDGHIHNMALRKVIKIFLANLWMVWRGMEGLTVTEPYIIKKNPAHNMIKPFTDKQPKSTYT